MNPHSVLTWQLLYELAALAPAGENAIGTI
jgi:hypothetical protein